jgi:Zn-dependent peptidase ImmA (M78 family)
MAVYIGDRIRQARMLRWRTSKELAQQLQWSPPRLTRAEQSESVEVTELEAKALRRFLRFPPSFFELEADPPLSESDLLFRAPKRTTKKEKIYLAEFARMTSLLAERLDMHHRLPAVRLPNDRVSATDIARVASDARLALQVSQDAPIGHLVHQLERAGVILVVRPNGLSPDDAERFDDAGGNRRSEVHYGYSTWIGEFRDRPLIVMRASASWERTRWTAAHELGHLLLHRHALPATAEDEASRFAGELLAPAESISTELTHPVTLATLIEIKSKWGISLGALLPHLWHSSLITRERFDALRTQLYTRMNPETGRTWGFDEPGWRDRPPERPRLLSAWCERSFASAEPTVVAAAMSLIPADLLAEMLREQRAGRRNPPAPTRPTAADGDAKVVSLSVARSGSRRHE